MAREAEEQQQHDRGGGQASDEWAGGGRAGLGQGGASEPAATWLALGRQRVSVAPSLSPPLRLLRLRLPLRSQTARRASHCVCRRGVCIYVHNKAAARPLAFICIITTSEQAHHIVCCLHLLLPSLSQATRLDFHIFPMN